MHNLGLRQRAAAPLPRAATSPSAAPSLTSASAPPVRAAALRVPAVAAHDPASISRVATGRRASTTAAASGPTRPLPAPRAADAAARAEVPSRRNVASKAAAGFPLRAARPPMQGNCVVLMETQLDATTSMQVSGEPGAGLRDYMAQAATNFANIKLPMGGKVTTIDDKHIAIVVPRIQILDFWLQPRAVAGLSSHGNSRIDFMSKTEHVQLDGSEHIKGARIADRFHMDVHMKFTWKRVDDGAEPAESSNGGDVPGRYNVVGTSSIMVEVDVPAPFSFMPYNLVERAANAGLHGTNRLIVESFVKNMAADYERWSADVVERQAFGAEEASSRQMTEEEELEELRAAAIAVLGTYEEAMRALE